MVITLDKRFIIFYKKRVKVIKQGKIIIKSVFNSIKRGEGNFILPLCILLREWKSHLDKIAYVGYCGCFGQ